MKTISLPMITWKVSPRIIFTGVVPVLIPWGAVFMSEVLPDVIVRYFIYTKGWVAWTLLEYCMHRWAFHTHKPGERNTEDRFKHNHHHTHPNQMILKRAHRMVAIATIMLTLFSLKYGPMLLTYFAGFLAGTASYMLMHWFLHKPAAAKYLPNLVKQHIWHHCKYPNKCFGITTTLWDRIFSTLPQNFKEVPERIIAFYYRKPGHTDKQDTRINSNKEVETTLLQEQAECFA